MWFWFAALAAICFGVGNVVVKRAQKDLPPLVDNLIATIITLTVVVPIVISMGVNFDLVAKVWPYSLVVAALYMTYYYVISKGNVTFTTTIMSTYPVVTAVLAMVFLGEALSGFQWAAVALVVIGVVVLDLDSFWGNMANMHTWLMWGGLGAVMIGVAEIVTHIATTNISVGTFTFMMSVSYVPAFLLCLFLDKKGRLEISKIRISNSWMTILGVGLVELGLIPYNIAFSLGEAALVSGVSSGRIVITAVLASVFLKERIDRYQVVGIGLVLLGVVFLGL